MEKKTFKDYIGDDQVISLVEISETMKAKKLTSVFQAKSGIPRLDALLEGFEAGELVVVSGPPKQGKTLFCQTLTCEFSNQGIVTLWFSYEMGLRQFLCRFPEKLPDACIPAKMKDNTLTWIEERIQEGIEKYHIKIVMIDHLHYIVDMERLRNPSLEIGVILRGLKKIAVKYGIIVFLVAHLGKVEEGKRPRADNIRDSSFLKAEPDTVIMVWRLKDNKEKHIENMAKISVELSRRTGIFEKTFKVMKIDGLLVEVAEIEREDE